MKSLKLGACLAALAVIGVGSAAMAAPAKSLSIKACSPVDRSYAQGYANGDCTSSGSSGGTVNSCTDNGDGTITFTWTCN